MDNNLNDYIKIYINKDTDLLNSYNDYLYKITNINFEDYLYYALSDFEEIHKATSDDINNLYKKTRKNYTNLRLKLSKKAPIGNRLISYSSIIKCNERTLRAIINNEIKLAAVEAFKKYVTMVIPTVERPICIDGIFTANEKTTLFDADKSLDIDNKKAYMSKDVYKRQTGIIQPLLFTNPSTEIIFVKKGEKSFLKSKTLDAKDQKIMDFLINEYKKVMYYPNQKLMYPLYKLSELVYGIKTKRYMDLIQQRLTKMSNNGQIVFNENDINSIELLNNNYKIINLFEVEFFTNDSNVRYCNIYMSRSIENDIKNNNTIKLYKNKIDKITNNFTLILVNYIQSLRITSLLKNDYMISVPYKILKMSIMMPFSKSKIKNIQALKKSFEELKNLEFLINDFEITGDNIKLYFIQFGLIELNELNLKNKIEELKIL